MRAVHGGDGAALAARITRQPGVVRHRAAAQTHGVAQRKGGRRPGPGGGRAAGQHRGHVLSVQRAWQLEPGTGVGGTGLELAGLQQTTFEQQLLQRVDPDLVVAQLRIVGQRLARGPAHVDIPGTGGAHGQRQRQRARFPAGVEEFTHGLGHDAAVPGLTAEIGVAQVGHGAAPGERARPVPIIESRVTSAASCSSFRCPLPTGRCGMTR